MHILTIFYVYLMRISKTKNIFLENILISATTYLKMLITKVNIIMSNTPEDLSIDDLKYFSVCLVFFNWLPTKLFSIQNQIRWNIFLWKLIDVISHQILTFSVIKKYIIFTDNFLKINLPSYFIIQTSKYCTKL